MRFDAPLKLGFLVRRYKRFLVDVEVPSCGVVTMHCPNTGAMTGCNNPGSRVWFSTSSSTKRKYAHTLEIVESNGEHVCVHSARANAIVAEALVLERIPELRGLPVRREVKIPGASGRFDFRIGGELGDLTFVEVKCVTLCRGDQGACPDAVSERAKRHVEALLRCLRDGHRAVLLFCAPHTGIQSVSTADDIHPEYGATVRKANSAGVEVLAYGCIVTPTEVTVDRPLPVFL
jgi:sugar fermentation stimulation protein A